LDSGNRLPTRSSIRQQGFIAKDVEFSAADLRAETKVALEKKQGFLYDGGLF
jgi:hypothetical protein